MGKMNHLIDQLLVSIPLAKQVNIIYYPELSGLCTLCIEALEAKDYPNQLSDNGMFIRFEINYDNGVGGISFDRSGHVWLSEADKQTPEYKHYAMRTLSSLVSKKFRKSKFKNDKELVKKVSEYANAVYDELLKYTGGYPYNNRK
ncbi:MAG: hypothetical protein ACRDD8_09630 [Bacteroidales bacterium]